MPSRRLDKSFPSIELSRAWEMLTGLEVQERIC